MPGSGTAAGAAGDGVAGAGAIIIVFLQYADMDSEASDLINVRIENGEAQGCGELLTILQVSLEEITERERSYARVGLKTGAHFADAETGQRTVA